MEGFIRVIVSRVEEFVNSKAIFVIIAILEHSEYGEMLAKVLTKYVPVIEKVPSHKGVEVLLKLLKK